MSRHAVHFGSAHSGTLEWMVQRLTALAIVLLGLVFLGRVLYWPDLDYLRWRAWWTREPVHLAVLVFTISVVAHSWAGLRSILRDYVHRPGLRLLLELLLACALLAEVLWCGQLLP